MIVDRISHDIPFYRAFLKHAALQGTYVINNSFWWSADDKFFNYALAGKLGVAVPRTAILPHKKHPVGTTDRSMRNLEYPLKWEELFEHVGFPAFLKPVDGGGWRDVFHVHNRDEFFNAYDQSRDLCMTLQAAVKFKEYFRCYVVGQEHVRVMPYDPRRPHAERYVLDPPEYDKKLIARVKKDAVTLCKALGYDLNTVEFAVEDGIPYAIDFMNPAPDADLHSVGAESFEWIVNEVAELAVKKAKASPYHTRASLGAIPGSCTFVRKLKGVAGEEQDEREKDYREKSFGEKDGSEGHATTCRSSAFGPAQILFVRRDGRDYNLFFMYGERTERTCGLPSPLESKRNTRPSIRLRGTCALTSRPRCWPRANCSWPNG